jgi:hypothetical protein
LESLREGESDRRVAAAIDELLRKR